MQTYLLPLPASPETAEELTAFVRDTFFAFLRENKFCSFSHSVNSGLRFPSRLFYFARVIFCGKEKWNKCKHFLLPLPPSPETAEELTAFARKKILLILSFCKFCSAFSFASFLLCEKYFLRFCGKEKWNKCKHILLPLPPSPETAEELTAFERNIILLILSFCKFCSAFSFASFLLARNFFCVFAGKRNE
jgi:hypothetical protein